jgi:predicted TIM-barrel fold metal-dependent hydrolase
MFVVDSQVHVWQADRPGRAWVPGAKAHLPQPFGYEDLRAEMDKAGVHRAVLVPPPWEGDRVDFALEAARKYPERFAVMGRLPLQHPDARAILETWLREPGLLGIRLNFLQDQHRKLITDGTADWFWPVAEMLDIPLMILAPSLLDEFGRIAARHPKLRIIIDHMGCGREHVDDAVTAQVGKTIELARYPNVAVKVSAIPCLSSAPYPFRNVWPSVRRVIEAFGARRSFWGTDVTRFLDKCSYRQSVAMFTEDMDFLSTSDKEWIMGRGLADCLRWPLPAA